MKEKIQAPVSVGWQILLLLGVMSFLCNGIIGSFLRQGVDFSFFYGAAQRVCHGDGASIYKEFLVSTGNADVYFWYPPPAAFLLAPLGFFGQATAWTLFQISNIALVALSAFLCPLLLNSTPAITPSPSGREAALSWALVLLFWPIYYNMHVGQTGVIVLFLLMAGMTLHLREKSVLAGLCLAGAFVLKPFILFLLFFLAAKRAYRLVGATLGWIVVLHVLSATVVPWETQLLYWQRSFVANRAVYVPAFGDNHSTSAFLYRLFTNNPFTTALWDVPRVVRFFEICIALAVTVQASIILRRDGRRLSPGVGEGYAILSMFLVSPLVTTAHLASLVIPLVILLHAYPNRWALVGFFCFFATNRPLINSVTSLERLAYFSHGLPTLVFALPAFGLLGLWIYATRLIQSPST